MIADEEIAQAKRRRYGPAKIFGLIAVAVLGVALVVLPRVLTPPPEGPFKETQSISALLAPAAEDGWRFARLEGRPSVLLIEFPSLQAQGAALNRIATLIEKAGAPRDRVLNDLEMAEFIRETGSAAATFYYGHDYRLTETTSGTETKNMGRNRAGDGACLLRPRAGRRSGHGACGRDAGRRRARVDPAA